MKKTMNAGTISAAYLVLNTARYSKLSESEKISVWKLLRALKPAAMDFMDATHDAEEKLKTSEDMSERLILAREFENLQCRGARMTPEEYFAFVSEYREYRRTVDTAVRELSEKEVVVDLTPISEDTFSKLISSNDWTMEQVTALGEIIIE